MEKNSSGVSPTEAASALDTLTEDRARLASRVEVPRTLMAAFGGVVGGLRGEHLSRGEL